MNISAADLAMTATAKDLRQLFEPYGMVDTMVGGLCSRGVGNHRYRP